MADVLFWHYGSAPGAFPADPFPLFHPEGFPSGLSLPLWTGRMPCRPSALVLVLLSCLVVLDWQAVLDFVSRFPRVERGHHMVGLERHASRHSRLDSERALHDHRVQCVSPHEEESL